MPEYNPAVPFHPDEHFAELPFRDVSTERNRPYALFRQLLYQLGFDRENFKTADWNPLGQLIKPGQSVVLNPNFVLSFHPGGGDLSSVVTHPSLLRAVIDYVFIALRGEGRIIIADAPQMNCDWEELMAYQRLGEIQSFYRDRLNFDVEVYDLRNFALIDGRRRAATANRKPLAGDPQGSVVVNLGTRSEFHGLPSENYYGADYDRQETIRHHHGSVHEYCLSRTILGSDVYIAVPKMKVHKKVGVTLTLKGLVGINTNKNYLVHYRLGTPCEGGDQLPDDRMRGTDRLIVKASRWVRDHLQARQSRASDILCQAAAIAYTSLIKPWRPLSAETQIRDAGNWYGNDSAWRMTIDLAKILHFCDAKGKIHDSPQRRLFSVIDGIIGGENNGPLSPDSRPSGCLVLGESPFAVDLVATRLMGFDYRKVKQLAFGTGNAWNFGLRSVADIDVVFDHSRSSGAEFFDESNVDPMLGYAPHPGWKGQIEVSEPLDRKAA
jgi:uncharacterized protein (DUF362 family)